MQYRITDWSYSLYRASLYCVKESVESVFFHRAHYFSAIWQDTQPNIMCHVRNMLKNIDADNGGFSRLYFHRGISPLLKVVTANMQTRYLIGTAVQKPQTWVQSTSCDLLKARGTEIKTGMVLWRIKSGKEKRVHLAMDPLYLVRLAGIEPTTPWFVA